MATRDRLFVIASAVGQITDESMKHMGHGARPAKSVPDGYEWNQSRAAKQLFAEAESWGISTQPDTNDRRFRADNCAGQEPD